MSPGGSVGTVFDVFFHSRLQGLAIFFVQIIKGFQHVRNGQLIGAFLDAGAASVAFENAFHG